MSHVMPNPGLPDPAQRQADYDLIVSTCFEVIRDCNEPQVRLEAARILQGMNPRPWGLAHSASWGVD